jgi:cyclomaltodextrinase / maltogenic alpha-amylase / neopullulanase
LRGILDKLDYLQDLGVNALYLNPIFAARTNHRYDTADYFKVDPALGDTALLKELMGQVHKRGMHLILDGGFNHYGDGFAPFQDVLKKGAASE